MICRQSRAGCRGSGPSRLRTTAAGSRKSFTDSRSSEAAATPAAWTRATPRASLGRTRSPMSAPLHTEFAIASRRTLLGLLLLALPGCAGNADCPSDLPDDSDCAEATPSYAREVSPVLEQYCE